MPRSLRAAAWLPIPLFLAAIGALWAADLRASYQSPALLLGLTLVFSTLVSAFIAYQIGRSFIVQGAPGLLLLGCGVLIWGAGGVTSVIIDQMQGDIGPNLPITIRNTSAWLSALCHLTGMAFTLRWRLALQAPRLWLATGYTLAVGAVGFIVLSAFSGWMPIFFVQGQGGTLWRQVVLSSAIAMFVLSAILLREANRPTLPRFVYWYINALLLLSVGYFGVLVQSVQASLLGWTGRTAQFLAGTYMFLAARAAARESGPEGITLGNQAPGDNTHRYFVAIATVLAAAALRLAFLQFLGLRATYITFYPAVMLAALYGGLRAGLLATVLAALLADYFWIEPVGQFAVADPADWLGIIVFMASCTMISFITEAMHQAEIRARTAGTRTEYADQQQAARELLLYNKKLTAERLNAFFPVAKAFAVAMAMLTVVAWLSFRNTTDMLESGRFEARDYALIQELDKLLFALNNAESDERVFLLTGDQKYLEPYRVTLGLVAEALTSLNRLTGDNPQQQKLLREIEAPVQEKITEIKQTIDLRQSQSFEAALSKIKGSMEKQLACMAHIHKHVSEFKARENKLLRERMEAMATRTRGEITTIVIGYLLSFVILSLVFLFLRKEIARRARAEARLTLHQEDLEKTVTLRTQELELANTTLQLENKERKEIEEALQRSNARLDLLAETAGQLLRSESPQEIVDGLCRKVMAFLDCHAFFNFLVDKEAGKLRLNAWAGIPEEEAKRIEWLDYGVAVCGCAARDGCRIIAENIPDTIDPRTELVKSFGLQAYACHPLTVEGKVIGTLSFGTRNRTRFLDDEIAMMRAVADQVAIAMFRQQTTEAFRASEERLRLVLNASMTGTFEVDLQTGAGQWNEVEFALLGLKPGDVPAGPETFFRFVHPDDRGPLQARWNEALRDGELDCEFRILRADGEERWLAGKGRFSYAGRADGDSPATLTRAARFLGVNYDITERKRAEETLRESEFRLHTLANAMPQLAWIAQPDGFISWYNQRWYDYTGTTPEQMEGWGWQNVHDPDQLPKVLSQWRASLSTGRPFEMEFPLRGADGCFRQFLTRGYPLKDMAGHVLRWFGTNTDVSERKQAEERLQASLHEKEVMLKEIHHRVKNNLQVISSLVDLQADALDNPALSGLFQDIRDRVRSMALVHEKLYRSDNLAQVEFDEYATSLLDYLWRSHGSSNTIRLKLDLQSVSLSVEKAVPCGLILNELAANALKHAFTGRDQGEVTVALRVDSNGLITLRVSDNGVGLPDGLDWRQSRSLGLRLVQMLSVQLNGTVDARTNDGAEFQISFAPSETDKRQDRTS